MTLPDFFRKNKIALTVSLPKDLIIERLENKITVTGTKNEISKFAEAIREVSKLRDGRLAKAGDYYFKVSEYMTEDRFRRNWIELPGQGWNVMASKFLEVVNQHEENPFYFNDCGYTDKLPLDIGVKVIDLDRAK